MSTTVRVLQEQDLDEANRFLHEHFDKHEPLLYSYFSRPGVVNDSPVAAFEDENVKEGLSLVVVDHSNGTERIVGVAFAGVLTEKKLEESWLEVKDAKRTGYFDHIDYFLIDIKRNAQFFKNFGVSEVLYLKIIAVDASMCRQGLGKRLATTLIDLGRTKGLPLLVATCTGEYSTRLMSSVGMECVHSQEYCDFKDDEGNVVFKPFPPHTKARIMVLKL